MPMFLFGPARPDHARGQTRPSWRMQLLEVLLFLVIISPLSAIFVYALIPGQIGFTFVAWSSIVRDLLLLAVVLFFIRRSGQSVRDLGWIRAGLWTEVRVGVLLFPLFFFGTALLQMALRALGLSGLSEPPGYLMPSGAPQLLLALGFIGVVAVTEETIFRGYLLLRLRAITRSSWAALLLSSLVFALGHGYQGSAGVITVGVMGVLLGAVYLWRGSLVAPMVMHFLQNFLGIVVVPLFGPAYT